MIIEFFLLISNSQQNEAKRCVYIWQVRRDSLVQITLNISIVIANNLELCVKAKFTENYFYDSIKQRWS